MSYIKQGITIWGGDPNDFPTDSDLLILIKKTGYANFWINGKHYFWDERIDKTKIDNSVLLFAFNGGKKEEEKKKKKGKIIIKKK